MWAENKQKDAWIPLWFGSPYNTRTTRGRPKKSCKSPSIFYVERLFNCPNENAARTADRVLNGCSAYRASSFNSAASR